MIISSVVNRVVAFSVFAVAFFLGGCEESPRSGMDAPTGMWEYAGPLPDGKQGILRVAIQEGPFLKYLGFRDPEIELTKEQTAEMASQLEQSWSSAPEMLVRFSEGEFRGHGGVTDGVLFLRHNSKDGTLESAYADSAGAIFLPVENFQEFKFPMGADGEAAEE